MRGTEDARNPTKRLKRPLLFLLSYSPESNNIIIILSAPWKIRTSISPAFGRSFHLDDRSDTTSYKYLFCGCRNYPLFKVQKESLVTRYPAFTAHGIIPRLLFYYSLPVCRSICKICGGGCTRNILSLGK